MSSEYVELLNSSILFFYSQCHNLIHVADMFQVLYFFNQRFDFLL